MRRFALILIGLPLFFLANSAARAQDKEPAVVIRVSSLNAFLKNVNLVIRLVGQEDAAAQIEGLIKSKIGKNGLEGIDPTRPLGAYVHFGKALDEVTGAVLIPIVDEKAFLTLLDNFGIKYEKGKDGIFTHKTDQNIDLYFRFANKYLYITGPNSNLIKNPADPAKALASPTNAAISIAVRVDLIPNDVKLVAVTQLEEAIQAAQKKAAPGETKVQGEFRIALLRDLGKVGTSVLSDAREIRFDLDLSEKTKEMTVNFSVAAKPGTGLAKSIQNLGDMKSPLAGLFKEGVAFQGSVHFALPDGLNKAFINVVIEEVKTSALKGITEEPTRARAKTLFEAMMPTAKAGEFQVVAAVLGPKDDRYTVVAAVKLKEGIKLGDTLRDLVKDALKGIPEAERNKIQLDIDSAGAIKIHKFQLPNDTELAPLIKLAGDNHLYIAFRDDALFLAIGAEALKTLKVAVAKTDSNPSPPVVFDFDVARMAKLMAKTDEQRDLAAKLFPADSTGRIRVSLGGGSSLNARLQMQLNVLEFLLKLQNNKGP